MTQRRKKYFVLARRSERGYTGGFRGVVTLAVPEWWSEKEGFSLARIFILITFYNCDL